MFSQNMLQLIFTELWDRMINYDVKDCLYHRIFMRMLLLKAIESGRCKGEASQLKFMQRCEHVMRLNVLTLCTDYRKGIFHLDL